MKRPEKCLDGLRPASLDGHTHALRVAQSAELGDAHLDVWRLEVLKDETNDALREILDEAEAFFCEERADVLHYDPVIDGIRDLSRLEYRVTRRQSDLEIELDRLW